MTLRILWTFLVAAGALAVAAPAANAQAPQPPPADCTPGPPYECPRWRNTDVQVTWYPSPSVTRDSPTGCSTAKPVVAAEGITRLECAVGNNAHQGWIWGTTEVWIDKTAPTATPGGATRPADGAGWYRSPVQIAFTGADALSGLASCTAPVYAGPDGASVSVSGTCTDNAGNVSAPAAFGLKYDSTGPVVRTGKPARKPDRRGWYIRPVRWRFTGADALSGLAACPRVRYAGPDGANAQVIGACRDHAGNVGTRGFRIKYDATPPARPIVRALSRDRAVRLVIAVASDVRRIRVVRGGRTIYRGRPRSIKDLQLRNYTRYRYTVIASDAAGHRSRQSASTVPKPELLSPSNRAVITSPPRLRWSKVVGADYYNVQLRRDGKKVLSAWPTRSKLQLKTRWRFDGRVRHMRPGSYEWNVWPGYGSRRAARYGARIGKGRTFVIPEAPPAP
jgi:hypothetical protein